MYHFATQIVFQSASTDGAIIYSYGDSSRLHIYTANSIFFVYSKYFCPKVSFFVSYIRRHGKITEMNAITLSPSNHGKLYYY